MTMRKNSWSPRRLLLTVLFLCVSASAALASGPSIQTISLPGAVARQPYSQTLSATGGTLPYTWSVVSGNLPFDVSLSAAGVLDGRPAADGTFNFVVRVSDALGQSDQKPLSIAVVFYTLTITTPSLPGGSLNQPYPPTPFAVAGGVPPYDWSLIGSLPPGLNFDGNAGILFGTPTEIRSKSFWVFVADANQRFGVKLFSVSIGATTPTINLVVDEIPEFEEESRGAFVNLNSDDDNANGIPDRLESGTVASEDDLLPFSIYYQPSNLTGTLTLSLDAFIQPSRIKVWTSATRGSELVLPRTWVLGAEPVPTTLFLEGTGTAPSSPVAHLVLTHSAGSLEDRVYLNVPDEDLDEADPLLSVPPFSEQDAADEVDTDFDELDDSPGPVVGASSILGARTAQTKVETIDPKNFETRESDAASLGKCNHVRKDGGSIFLKSREEKKRFDDLALEKVDKASGKASIKFNDNSEAEVKVEFFITAYDVWHPTAQSVVGAEMATLAESPAGTEISFSHLLAEGSKVTLKKAGENRIRTWVPPKVPVLDLDGRGQGQFTRGRKWVGAADTDVLNIRLYDDPAGLGGLANGTNWPLTGEKLETGDSLTWTAKFLMIVAAIKPSVSENSKFVGVIPWGFELEMTIAAKPSEAKRKVTLLPAVLLTSKKEKDAAIAAFNRAKENGHSTITGWTQTSAFKLRPKHNNTKCLEVDIGQDSQGLANGEKVQQAACADPLGANQKWRFVYVGDNHYTVRPLHIAGVSKCLDIDVADNTQGQANGVKAQQWACNGQDNQKWRILDYAGGVSEVKAKHSGKCLAIENGAVGNGARAVQLPCPGGQAGNDHVKWEIQPAD